MTTQSAPAAPAEPISPTDVAKLLAEHAENDGQELARALDQLAEIAETLAETGRAARSHGVPATQIPAVYSKASEAVALLCRHGRWNLRSHKITGDVK